MSRRKRRTVAHRLARRMAKLEHRHDRQMQKLKAELIAAVYHALPVQEPR